MNLSNLPKNIVDYLPEAGGVLGGTAGLALGGLAPMGAFAGYGGGKVLEDYFGPMVGLGQQDAGDALYEASLAGMGGSAVQDVLSLLNNVNIATKKFPTPVKEVPSQFSRDPTFGKELDIERTKRVLPEVPGGYTRMYRGEGQSVGHQDVWPKGTVQLPPQMDKKLAQIYSQGGDAGKFFTPDLGYADYYRQSYGPDARLFYTDVPNRLLNKFELIPNLEYFIDKVFLK